MGPSGKKNQLSPTWPVYLIRLDDYNQIYSCLAKDKKPKISGLRSHS